MVQVITAGPGGQNPGGDPQLKKTKLKKDVRSDQVNGSEGPGGAVLPSDLFEEPRTNKKALFDNVAQKELPLPSDWIQALEPEGTGSKESFQKYQMADALVRSVTAEAATDSRDTIIHKARPAFLPTLRRMIREVKKFKARSHEERRMRPQLLARLEGLNKPEGISYFALTEQVYPFLRLITKDRTPSLKMTELEKNRHALWMMSAPQKFFIPTFEDATIMDFVIPSPVSWGGLILGTAHADAAVMDPYTFFAHDDWCHFQRIAGYEEKLPGSDNPGPFYQEVLPERYRSYAQLQLQIENQFPDNQRVREAVRVLLFEGIHEEALPQFNPEQLRESFDKVPWDHAVTGFFTGVPTRDPYYYSIRPEDMEAALSFLASLAGYEPPNDNKLPKTSKRAFETLRALRGKNAEQIEEWYRKSLSSVSVTSEPDARVSGSPITPKPAGPGDCYRLVEPRSIQTRQGSTEKYKIADAFVKAVEAEVLGGASREQIIQTPRSELLPILSDIINRAESVLPLSEGADPFLTKLRQLHQPEGVSYSDLMAVLGPTTRLLSMTNWDVHSLEMTEREKNQHDLWMKTAPFHFLLPTFEPVTRLDRFNPAPVYWASLDQNPAGVLGHRDGFGTHGDPRNQLVVADEIFRALVLNDVANEPSRDAKAFFGHELQERYASLARLKDAVQAGTDDPAVQDAVFLLLSFEYQETDNTPGLFSLNELPEIFAAAPWDLYVIGFLHDRDLHDPYYEAIGPQQLKDALQLLSKLSRQPDSPGFAKALTYLEDIPATPDRTSTPSP